MKNILRTAKVKDLCSQKGITYLGLFGSQTTNKAAESSDVDLLVEYSHDSPVKTLFDHMDVQYKFEDILGKRVDLITRRSLHKYIEKEVLNSVEEICINE